MAGLKMNVEFPTRLCEVEGSVISGKIESWKDYDDGDQIQVKIDGTTYLVHSVNIVLIKE